MDKNKGVQQETLESVAGAAGTSADMSAPTNVLLKPERKVKDTHNDRLKAKSQVSPEDEVLAVKMFAGKVVPGEGKDYANGKDTRGTVAKIIKDVLCSKIKGVVHLGFKTRKIMKSDVDVVKESKVKAILRDLAD